MTESKAYEIAAQCLKLIEHEVDPSKLQTIADYIVIALRTVHSPHLHEPDDTAIDPKFHTLSNASLALLLGDYTRSIHITNEMGAEIAYPNGKVWADAFEFQLPREAIITELTRMEAWIITHQQHIDAAVAEAKVNGDW